MNSLEFTRFPELSYSVTEAVNTLCTNLMFLGKDKKKIMMTSCHASEGKSFMSLCLLRTLASLGKSVVLVDADLRRSQSAAVYGMRMHSENRYGTTHYLAGMCEAEDVVYTTDVPNAYLVPVGRTVTNSLQLLTNSRLSELLAKLEKTYDYVLVDAPPVGVIIDAAEIAKSCDETIFVIKYNSIARKELLEAKQQIERAGCDVLGAVLNEVDVNTLSNKKYYYNKSYYSKEDSAYMPKKDKKEHEAHREKSSRT